MRRYAWIATLLIVALVATWCSSSLVQDKVTEATQWLMQKDQNYEQGFEVTRAFVYGAFYSSGNYLNLSSKELTQIPDLCSLMDEQDRDKVRFLSLSNNKIRIVDQDLSCFKHLRVLNLSYNQIVEVVRLGELPELQELLLHKNQLANTKNLPDFPALKTLNLAYNKLKKVVDLEKFSALTTLELQHNEIAKIIGIDKLQKLEELKLEYNKLKKLPFLETLQQLKTVTAQGNQLQQEVQNTLKKLQQTYFQLVWTGTSGTGS